MLKAVVRDKDILEPCMADRLLFVVQEAEEIGAVLAETKNHPHISPGNGPATVCVVGIGLLADPCRYWREASQVTPAFGGSAEVPKVLANDHLCAVQMWHHTKGSL